MASIRSKLGIAVAALAATTLLAGTAFAGGNPNAPGNGNGNSPAKGGTPPGQAKKGTPAQGNGKASKGKALGKAKQANKSHPAHPAHPVHPVTPTHSSQGQAQGQSASHKPAFAATKGKGHEKTAGHKVIICHRTGSATNPYVQINVSINAWLNGHNKHPALDGRSDILLQDPASPGEKLSGSECPGAQPSGASGGVSGEVQTVKRINPPRPAGGVLGATASTPQARPRSGSAGAGVLGVFSSRVTRGQLPFTGLPLWPVALAAFALLAAGMLLRRRGGQLA